MINSEFSSLYNYLKKVTYHDFLDFIKKQKVLVLMCSLSIFLMYGLKLLNYVYGIDTELYMGDQKYINWIEIGRFGLVGLQKLFWQGTFFNPYTAIFFALLFLLISDLLFCYMFNLFSDGTISTISFYVFSLFYLSSGTWCEQLYFTCQCTECIFIVCLVPIGVYCLFYGLFFHKKINIVIGGIILVLITSVYQAVLPLYATTILSCIILLRDTNFQACTDKKMEKSWFLICLQFLCILIFSVLVYFILNKIVISVTGHNESHYLYSMVGHGGVSSHSSIILFLLHIYEITIGNIPFVQKLCSPISANHARTGMNAVAEINANSFYARWIYIPISILYITLLIKSCKKRYTYILCGVGVLICIFALSLIGFVTSRTEYALSFAVPFMAIYCIGKLNNRFFRIFLISVLLIESFFSIQKICNLTYFDKLRFDSEKEIAIELDKDLQRCIFENNADENIPVLFYGNFTIPVSEHFMKTKLLGYGAFSYPPLQVVPINDKISNRPNAFMKTLNMVYNYSSSSELQAKAIEYAQSEMNCYPLDNSVKYYNDFILVKLSE